MRQLVGEIKSLVARDRFLHRPQYMKNKKARINEFSKLFKLVKRLLDRYLHTVSLHEIYKKLCSTNYIKVVGKKRANKNTSVLQKYPYFLLTIKESSRCSALIETYKFFDSDEGALTVNWVLNYAYKNIHLIKRDNFLEYHKDRKIIPEIFESYKDLNFSDLDKIKRRLENNQDRIKNLKTYRDKFLVHDDIAKKEYDIIKKENLIVFRDIQILLKIVEDLLNLFYLKLDFASNDYNNYKKEPTREIEMLFDDLVKQEEFRLEQIKIKYKNYL